MDVRIAQPLGYSELGGRSNNEDSIFPDPQYTSPLQRWFLVCDGVGGAERGEVASHLAVDSFNTFLDQRPVTVPTDGYIQQAVSYVEDQFNAYFVENPNALGMATTMTLLYIHEAGATVAHIGDSRVYHIRAGTVIWRTDDHSYVNELVKAGVLTPAEAHGHPKRNIITRALQGGEKRVQASVQLLNDLRPGDYFFMCSDGVMERVSDELLEGTLRHTADSNEEKMAKLRAYSSGNTRDNFTAYLIQVAHVTGTVDPAYRVAPPLYDRFDADSDPDEAITLINMPVPETSTDELVQPSVAQPAHSPRPELQTSPAPVPSAPVWRASAEPEPDRARPVKVPVRKAVGPGAMALFALLGVSIGVGGLMAWQHVTNNTRVAQQLAMTGKRTTTATPVAGPQRTGAIGAVISSATSESVGQAHLQTQPNAEATASATITSSTVAQTSEKQDESPLGSSSKSSTDGDAEYKVVQQVDDQLAVVEDTKTSLLGLRKKNGHWTAKPIYSHIGPFRHGIATVESPKVSAKFLNRDGRSFDEMRASSNGKIAVRQGTRWGYINTDEGRVALYIKYDQAEPFGKDGTAHVTLNGKAILINEQGNKVSHKDYAKSADKKSEGKKG